jgi:DNA anti-recombination protein RmuC
MSRNALIATHTTLLASALIIGSVVAHYNVVEAIDRIQAEVTSIEEKMRTLADLTDRNGADESISRIVADCPRRSEYESLLNSLATLQKRDLIAIQNLHESCGSFYAEQ